MSVGKVEPSLVNCGDSVVLNRQVYSVHDIQGPDSHGVYDAYLKSANGSIVHQVVTEPVTIILQ